MSEPTAEEIVAEFAGYRHALTIEKKDQLTDQIRAYRDAEVLKLLGELDHALEWCVGDDVPVAAVHRSIDMLRKRYADKSQASG